MNVVIRPSPEVFRRKSRVLVVFGAFRRYDRPYDCLPGDEGRLADMVSKARNYRVMLAFCRKVSESGNSFPGSWLPGCRPRVTDMVFNFSGSTCYSNPELVEALARFGRDEIAVTGPTHDSDIDSALEGSYRHGLVVKRISPQNALQICSAGGSSFVRDAYFPPQPGQTQATGYSDWVNNLRIIESTE
jgi:hypothetical protein